MLRRLATVVAVTTALALGAAAPALADPTSLPYTGQGTENGACANVRFDSQVPEGRQIWQFNLTGQDNPEDARMDAVFSDGTTVDDKAPDATPGKVAHFFIETAQGATVVSATAFFDSDQVTGKPQFVVSHCVKGKKGDDGDGNGDGNGDDNGNGDENGKDDENGNGKDDDGKKDDDVKETPKPAVPTSVPAGVADSGNSNTAGMIGLFAVFAGMAAGVAVLVRRRFVEGN